MVNPLDLYARATARLPLTPGERAALKVWDQLVLSAAGGAAVEIVKALVTGSTPLTLPALTQIGEYAFVIALLTGLSKLFRANGDAASLAVADALDQEAGHLDRLDRQEKRPLAGAAPMDPTTRPAAAVPAPSPAPTSLGPLASRLTAAVASMAVADTRDTRDARQPVPPSRQAVSSSQTTYRMPASPDLPLSAPQAQPAQPAQPAPVNEPSMSALQATMVAPAAVTAAASGSASGSTSLAQVLKAAGGSPTTPSPVGVNEPPTPDPDRTVPNLPAFLKQ